MQIMLTSDSPHAAYVVVNWEGDTSSRTGPVEVVVPGITGGLPQWTTAKFPDGSPAIIEIDYEGSGEMTVTTKIYPDADHSFLIGSYWNKYSNGFWSVKDMGDSGTASGWIGAFDDGISTDEFQISLPVGLFDPYYGRLASEAPVGAAADVDLRAMGSAAPDGDTSDDASTSDPGTRTLRSQSITGDYQVVKHHQTRVEKLATKMHNKGGVLTVHAYGPDENLAMDRARAVRSHIEAHLVKRGHVGTSPIYVIYGGDPDHKDTHTTVHWHPAVTLPGAMPGAK